ncbi:MAG: peptide ABC transporter permease [Candidatus Marinimicrobia bacterium]|nr:peptide ABC transporter permease [Candidatus Neomarinimicrobiota bacterium]
MNFLVYILKKLTYLTTVLVGIIIILFIIVQMIPGDPARAAAGQGASKERVSEIRKEFGLDLPVYIQIYRYFGRIINLDLGKSISTKKDVLDEIILYLPASMELVVSAMFINIFFGILIGIYSAVKPRQIIDKLSNIITILGMGLPIFWVGIISQLLFYKILDIFPYGGRLPAGINPPAHQTGSYIIDSLLTGDIGLLSISLHHLILPAFIMSLPELAVTVRIMRNSILNVLNKDYIVTAKAKGLNKNRILFVHALKNAIMIPISLFGMQTGWILGGTLLVESVFSWGGLGYLAYNAIYKRDFPIIMGVTLVISLCFVLANFSVDIIHKYVDKRIT